MKMKRGEEHLRSTLRIEKSVNASMQDIVVDAKFGRDLQLDRQALASNVAPAKLQCHRCTRSTGQGFANDRGNKGQHGR
jgi:hypothetical protein